MDVKGNITIETALIVSVVIIITLSFTLRAVKEMYASGIGSVFYYVDMNHAFREGMVDEGEESPVFGRSGDLEIRKGFLGDKYTSVRRYGGFEIRNELEVRRMHISFLVNQAISDKIGDFSESLQSPNGGAEDEEVTQDSEEGGDDDVGVDEKHDVR